MQGVRGSSPRSSTTRDETADPHPSPARRGDPSPRTNVTETTDTSETDTRHRIERYDPTAIEPRWQARWAELGMHDTDLSDVAAEVLPVDDVPVSVGRHPYRPLVHHDADRRDRALPPDARRERVPADRLRRVRAAGRERGDQERRTPARLDDVEHRQHAPPAALDGRDVRLGRRGRHLRPELLPLEPVVLPALPGGRRWPTARSRRSTGVPTTARSRASRSRARTATAGAAARPRREARPGAVVPAHHGVRRRAARLLRDPVPGPDPDHADELDRAVRGRRDRVRGRRPPRISGAASGSASSPRAPTRCSAPRSSSSRRSIRWSRGCPTGPPGRRRCLRGAGRASTRDRTLRPRIARRPACPLRADAINPVNGERIPIWVADYVLATYGTGAIMAVPAHDERDFAFAKKYRLEIRRDRRRPGRAGRCPTRGRLHRSCRGRGAAQQRPVHRAPAAEGGGKAIRPPGWPSAASPEPKVTYRLRDWLVSRQRYWGTPIPIIYCPKDGVVPVPYIGLAFRLPETVDYAGSGDNPLNHDEEAFLRVDCPRCGGPARREN